VNGVCNGGGLLGGYYGGLGGGYGGALGGLSGLGPGGGANKCKFYLNLKFFCHRGTMSVVRAKI
jgi:hypothetical protein